MQEKMEIFIKNAFKNNRNPQQKQTACLPLL